MMMSFICSCRNKKKTLSRLCSQMLPPPQSTQRLVRRLCGHFVCGCVVLALFSLLCVSGSSRPSPPHVSLPPRPGTLGTCHTACHADTCPLPCLRPYHCSLLLRKRPAPPPPCPCPCPQWHCLPWRTCLPRWPSTPSGPQSGGHALVTRGLGHPQALDLANLRRSG